MRTHPAFESELEKSLLEDQDGAFVRDLQGSLQDFVEDVERHVREGLDQERYVKWRDLQKSAEAAAALVEELRDRLREQAPAS